MNYLPTCTSRLVVQHLCQVSFKSMQGCRRSWEDIIWCDGMTEWQKDGMTEWREDGMTDKANTKCPLAILWRGHKNKQTDHEMDQKLDALEFHPGAWTWKRWSKNILVVQPLFKSKHGNYQDDFIVIIDTNLVHCVPSGSASVDREASAQFHTTGCTPCYRFPPRNSWLPLWCGADTDASGVPTSPASKKSTKCSG